MPLTEKQFMAQVRDLTKIFGWHFYHTWRSIHSPAGFPDLIICKTLLSGDSVMIASELKSETGKFSQLQMEWIEILDKIQGVFAFAWIPPQIEDIADVLRSEGIPDIMIVWKKHALFAKERFGLNLATQQKG